MKLTALTVAKALEALGLEEYKTALAFGKELRARGSNGAAKKPRKNAWVARRKNTAAKEKAAIKVAKKAAKIKKSVAAEVTEEA
jgi:hypothetical protein